VAGPRLEAETSTSSVEMAQIAPAILKVLGINLSKLEEVRRANISVLPGLFLGFEECDN